MSDVDAADPEAHDQDQEGRMSTTGHAPPDDTLGPIDVTTWAYAIGGSVAGLLLVVALLVAGGG